jgi:hypothetical protein
VRLIRGLVGWPLCSKPIRLVLEELLCEQQRPWATSRDLSARRRRRDLLGEAIERLGGPKIRSDEALAEAAVDLREQLTRLLGPVYSMP